MNKLAGLMIGAMMLAPAALAQPYNAGPVQGEPPGPVKIPDAPQLPYHFGERPVAPNGEKFGNVAAITTPIVIGYIVAATGSFAGALVFVGANAVVAIISYLFIVGTIQRIELSDNEGSVRSAVLREASHEESG